MTHDYENIISATEMANEWACHWAAHKHGLTAEQADSCDDGEHRCPTCPFTLRADRVEAGE